MFKNILNKSFVFQLMHGPKLFRSESTYKELENVRIQWWKNPLVLNFHL